MSGEAGAKMAKTTEGAGENSSETVKMTLYISKSVAKEFKKLAIDEEKDYSELATLALSDFVRRQRE